MTYTKDELLEEAIKVSEAHSVDVVYATEDGQLFLSENFANNHNLKVVKGTEFFTYDFSETEKEEVEPENDDDHKEARNHATAEEIAAEAEKEASQGGGAQS